VGGEQVAFHLVGDELERPAPGLARFHALLLQSQPLANPADSSAWNHADLDVAKSSRGSVTSITTSGDGWAATARSASPPSLPGLPVGIRNSTIFRSPNSDIDCWASTSWLQ
jgi:hypothetical protein